ncbi:response regulator [Hydrogenimonas thermophila]|uniref:response regulator n=1 Tax=Hydrogenimonas thermophila TaxID=223786 RepID=UPI002936E8CE|nr:response regulator [Hydrogenimonas thermophila]WOE70735.1 response regulator [Hydrogenimonas thermophila]WOE73252.1 response regulator [Hydrogenimonas thermophila]
MNIMIVDDEKKLRDTLKSIIENKIGVDIKITEAEDGKKALDLIQHERVDILLTDIMMPNMNGFELISRVKNSNKTKNIFIAAITGLGGEEQIEKIYASGADFYIAKPFHIDDIVARLKFIIQFIKKDKYQTILPQKDVENLFNDYYLQNCITIFNMQKEADLFLLWKHFSQEDLVSASDSLKDIIVEFVKIYRFLSRENKSPKFKILLEYSRNFAYLTVKDKLCTEAAEKIIKSSEYKDIKFKDDCFTIRLNLIREENNKESIQTLYEQVKAIDFMTILSEDIDYYIEDVDEAKEAYLYLLNDKNEISADLIYESSEFFENCFHLLNHLAEFGHLAEAVKDVYSYLKEFDAKEREKQKNIIRNINDFIILFEKWLKSIFKNKDVNDIHFMDIELLEQCKKIIQN